MCLLLLLMPVEALTMSAALIPAALRAIATLSAANILPSNYSNATQYAEVWETQASTFFQVDISSTNAQARLNNYIQQSNLSSALLYGAGSLNGSSNSSAGGMSGNMSLGWDDSTQLIGGGPDVSTFYALSLKADFSPVEVSRQWKLEHADE